jgi:hypothetical protein
LKSIASQVARLASLAAIGVCLAVPAFAKAPLVDAARFGKKPTQDGQGRTLYLIQLAPDAFDVMPRLADAADAARFADRHSRKAAEAVRAFEMRLGFRHVSMTSHVANSVSAYLAPGQLQQVLDHPSVTAVYEDVPIAFSAFSAPWSNTTAANGEEIGWGRTALNGLSSPLAASRPWVYIIDAGAALHQDLPADMERRNPANGPLAGCYAHGTHVAGIVGSHLGNGGVAGMAPGARLVSVSVLPATGPTGQCAVADSRDTDLDDQTSTNGSFVIAAMDDVKALIAARGTLGIVNISMNGTWFGPAGPIRAAMDSLANPAGNYRGALIVQSAGNNGGDACNVSYGATSPNRVLVVGGANEQGQYANWFPNDGRYAQPGGASNNGTCVDVYAPSVNIWSTWGPLAGPNDPIAPPQNQWQQYTLGDRVQLSGTSMAAPHIAGMAAVLLSRNANLTPEGLAGEVLAQRFTADFAIWMTRLPDSDADSDSDHVPYPREIAEGLNPAIRDNAVFSYHRLFAGQVARDLVQREATAGELATWSGQITSGTARETIVHTVLTAAESQEVIGAIARLYFAYFLRVPDFGGLMFWTTELRTGRMGLDTVSSYFAASAEFIQMYGSLNNSNFVRQVYLNVLNREPDQGGWTFWTAQLDSGAYTRGGVMVQFANSAEYRGIIGNEVYVTLAYAGLLRRAPDSGGYNFWVSWLDAGNPHTGFVNATLYGGEYGARFP